MKKKEKNQTKMERKDERINADTLFEQRYFCKLCNKSIAPEELTEHRNQHIKDSDVFSAPCKLNEHPKTGLCIIKEQYDSCQSINNWMCWRDGILISHPEKEGEP